MANFTIGELIQSSTANRLGIDNNPTSTVRVHLTETITLLESIRAEWEEYCAEHSLGTPAIRVSSGYRSPELNKAVGGVKNSVSKMSLKSSLQQSFPIWVMPLTKSLSRSRRHPDGCTWVINVRTGSKEGSVSH